MARFSKIIAFLAGLFIAAAQPVWAQNEGRIVLQAPDLTSFPNVSLTFEAYDVQGNFLNDLAQNELEVVENDQKIPINTLSRTQPGMHIIFAFNVSPGMAVAIATGPTNFERVKQNIIDWTEALPGNIPDQLSLVTNAGPQVTRLANPAQFTQALRAYAPDLAKTQPSLTSLITALDLASDPSRKVNSKRAVLYITSSLPDPALTALPNLADRANQLGVRIFTWLVNPEAGENKTSQVLADLAQHTGGQSLIFSGVESLPNPEVYFQSMRFIYRTSYTSTIHQSGTQRVSLAIRRSDFPTAAEQRFTLNLQPPNPFFLSPPTEVKRIWTKPEASEKPVLDPTQVELQAIVEFPDGLRRPIKASRLFVDGKLVYEMTVDPFNPLIWPLEAYTSSGQHVLRVEMEDILGLSRSSIEIPVNVEVETPPALNLVLLATQALPYLPIAGAVGIGAAAVIGGLAGLRAWRKRQVRAPKSPINGNSNRSSRRRVDIPIPARRLPHNSLNAPARLVQVVEGNFLQPGTFISLNQDEMRLGSEARRVDCVIESPTVDGLHARIRRTGHGQFIISDAGSVAGTWVNFELVPPEGQVLSQGDLIHLGLEVYRFELKNGPVPSQPRITSTQEVG
jgi:hypothetical protein